MNIKKAEGPVQTVPSYTEVKAVKDVAQELRGRTMHLIWNYKAWRSRHSEDQIAANDYLLMEDDLLKVQIGEMFGLYHATFCDYLDLYDRLIASVNERQIPFMQPLPQEQQTRLCA